MWWERDRTGWPVVFIALVNIKTNQYFSKTKRSVRLKKNTNTKCILIKKFFPYVLGSVHTWCPGTVPGFCSTPGTNVNTPFSWYPRLNSGTVPVPEYKVSTLYSGTKLGTESLCEHIFRWCPGTLPTNHLFSYPQFLVPLEISIVSVCSVYWMWTYLQTGYRVSEHSTILCRCPGTSARAPSVNTA